MASWLLNTESRYGAVAMLLHWGMALLLVGLIVVGWYMVWLPDVGFDKEKITLILTHKSLGMLAVLLAAVRIAWRVASPLPQLAQGIPDWQQVIARFAHLCFYALMLALPITGWLMSSAGGYPVYLFVLYGRMPDFIGLDPYLFELLREVHLWLSHAMVVLLVVHMTAALGHHLVLKDDTLEKMLP
jgi:cytochrome b561